MYPDFAKKMKTLPPARKPEPPPAPARPAPRAAR
jgi:hypothetical protein